MFLFKLHKDTVTAPELVYQLTYEMILMVSMFKFCLLSISEVLVEYKAFSLASGLSMNHPMLLIPLNREGKREGNYNYGSTPILYNAK